MERNKIAKLASMLMIELIKTDLPNKEINRLNDIVGEIRDEAINYTRCCTELKDKETPTFEDWLKDKFIKISDTDYTNKDQDCIWGYYELEDIYKLMN